MLRFKLLNCLLCCLHYGLPEGSCATQAIFLFVRARTAMSVVTHAQSEVHYKLLVLLHGAATHLAVPHPAFLHPTALSDFALVLQEHPAFPEHFSGLSG